MRCYLVVSFVVMLIIKSSILSGQTVDLNIQSGYVELPSFSEEEIFMRNYFFGQIINPNGVRGKNFSLRLVIKSRNLTITSRVDRSSYITLNGEAVKIVDIDKIARLFRLDDLVFQGISKEDYLAYGLPDGLYEVCFEMVDVTFDANNTVSKGCILQQVKTQNAPVFTQPNNNSVLSLDAAALFQWRPRHITAYPVSYEYFIYEYQDNWTYGQALAFDKPIVSFTTNALSNLVQTQDLSKYVNKKLVAVVRVFSDNRNLKFKNNGFSDPIIFSISETGRNEGEEMSCEIPDAEFFINEISQGCKSSGLGSKEYIELVVAKGKAGIWNLNQRIIDDNNYLLPEVGNEPGHIKLGSCFSSVPTGTIILIYNDQDIHPLINPANDGKPNANGVYQLPFSDSCIEKYDYCPNQKTNDDYSCGLSKYPLEWNNYIPMRNDKDVLQIRSWDQSFVHGLRWGNAPNENQTDARMVTMTSGSAENKTFVFEKGTNWNAVENWKTVVACTGSEGITNQGQESPGYPNSIANQLLIDAIKNGTLANEFTVECATLTFPSMGGEISMNNGSGIYEITIGDSDPIITSDNPYIVSGYPLGSYTVTVRDTVFDCTAFCSLGIECEGVGQECNDYNDCTINDVLNYQCECEGEQIVDVVIEEEVQLDSLCTYCIPIGPTFYELSAEDYILTHAITLELPSGTVVTLDNDDNAQGFNFPYCYGGPPTNCYGYPATISELPSHFNGWVDNNQYEGAFTGDKYCSIGLFMSLSNLDILELTGTNSAGDTIHMYPINKVCEYDTTYQLYIESGCDSIAQYTWSTGEETSSIEIDTLGGCYEVTITCVTDSTDYCELIGQYGEGCEDCIVGQSCDDNNPCTANDQIDVNCACVGVLYPDSDGDGICDELDECFGFDDNEDSDADGVPDGCDLCHGQPDSVLPQEVVLLLTDKNPDNDPDLSPWGCEEYPCNDEFEILKTPIGSELCNYCLNLTELVDLGDDLTHITSVNYLEDGVEKSFEYDGEGVIAEDDFEQGWGIWSGNYDCHRRDTILSNSPDYCIEIRDNSSYSRMTTQKLNLCNTYSVTISFSFLTQGYDHAGHKFQVQYQQPGISYTPIKQFVYGQDFTNNVRYFESIEIQGPFSTETRFRIRSYADNDSDVLYIDDVKLTGKKSNAYSCNDTDDDDFIKKSWLNYFAQELDYFGYASGVDYVDGVSALCDTVGNIVTVKDSQVELISVAYYTSEGTGLVSFDSPNCGDLGPGEQYTEYEVSIDCEDPEILWSNGMTTQSILVPSGGGYSVTVTCPDGCEYTEDIQGDCEVGTGPCQPSLCYENDGYYDEFCNCVGATLIENGDPDGDGLCGEDDPCTCDGENVDSDGDGICDCEECPPIANIFKKIKSEPVLTEYCDYKIPIYLAAGQNLNDVTFDNVSIKEEEPFNFKYCYEFVELECENSSDIFDQTYKVIPSLRKFISDFRYYLNSQEITNFVFKDTLINNLDHFILRNIPETAISFKFNNTIVDAIQLDCYEVQTGQKLYVNSTINGPNDYQCVPDKYEWSNGDTSSTIIIPYPSTAGYCLTITCEDGCEVETCLEGSCLFGAPCYDYDSCTVNDVYDAFCNCVGSSEPDSDKDGVSDACDLCPGHDDSKDKDNDGIPDGCDDCSVSDEPELCDYCTQFPYIFNSEYLLLEKFDITLNGDQVASDLNNEIYGLCLSFGSTDNCPGGSQENLLIEIINEWMLYHGYSGEASLIKPIVGSHPCCPATSDKGGSSDSRAPACVVLTIENTNLSFNNLSASYGGQSGSTSFFQHNCTGGGGEPEPCDDDDPCTIDDHYDEDCNCVGTFLDEDEDWVCDLYDKCPGHPDYMDADGDGIPDGCDEIEIPCDTSTYLTFCEYLENRIECATKPEPMIIQHDLRTIQSELKIFFAELNWDPEHFYLPKLMKDLQDSVDSDDDGIVDYLDPCPCYKNQSLLSTGKLTEWERVECCGQALTADCGGAVSNIITDGTQAQMIAQWMFAVQQDFDEFDQPPACAEALGLEMIETAEGWTYTSDTCTAKFSVNCECECSLEIVDDFDGDGICNAIDTIYGEECNITCETDVCQYAVIEDCECVYKDLPDSDGDGVCDLIDICQPAPGITFDPGSTPQQFDDTLDSDNDGTPDCLDVCPNGEGWMGIQNPEIPTPTGPGDPCDDGDPCTFADAIDDNCTCTGILLDFDNDGTTDCGDCIIYYDDTSTVAVDYVEVNANINFIDCDNCYFIGLDMDEDGVPDIPCDICPELSDSTDYNMNGVPDCIDPPYKEIGCPDTSAIIFMPEAGIMLSFNSEEIELDDLPNPIGAIISAKTGGADDIYTYDYVTLTFTREVDGNFEAFYAIPDLGYSGVLEYAGVSYANHQNCVIYSNEDNVGVTCPTEISVNSNTGQLQLQIDIPTGNNADLLNFYGTYSVDLTSNQGSPTINMNADVAGNDILSNGGDSYTVLLNVAPSGVSGLAGYSGSITLPNGLACPYTNGGLDSCPDPAIIIGHPCDDGDICTHHDRYDENCECTGDAKPDSDGDGLCDEIDPCPNEPNIGPDNDGDGFPDCPCPPVVLTADVIISGGDVLFPFDESSAGGIDQYNFSISGGPDGVITDTTSTEAPVTVSNLPKGYVYEITVSAQGSNGCVSDTTITVDVPFETDPALCGVEIDDELLLSVSLLPALNNGDEFIASDFTIYVKDAKGSFGTFTGKGYIKIPVFGNPRINVTFNEVRIASNYQMVDGCVVVNGFGLAVLGDPLSDEINSVLTDIISVLDDLNDILDELIPVLEQIDELVATTETMVSQETKDCIEVAKNELDSLRQIAELDPNHPNIIDLIKDKADELQDCIDQYENEIALILDRLPNILNACFAAEVTSCSGYESLLTEINNIKTNVSGLRETMKDNTLASLPLSTTTSVLTMSAEIDSTGETDLPTPIFNQQINDQVNLYYEKETEYQVCSFLSKVELIVQDPEGTLENVKLILKLFVEASDDLSTELGTYINDGLTDQEIIDLLLETNTTNNPSDQSRFIQAIRNTVIYESYKN